MNLLIRPFEEGDVPALISIWNEVVSGGKAFPQTEELTKESGLAFFRAQSLTAAAVEKESGDIVGLYILHPNNVGRCAHLANASYAVKGEFRGAHIGEALVSHCLEAAKDLGFRILQFNAVVKSNASALHLYEKLGFVRLGTIPGGFLNKSGEYEDIIPHYRVL